MQEESNGELAFFCTFLSEAMGFFWHYHVRNQVKQNNTLTSTKEVSFPSLQELIQL